MQTPNFVVSGHVTLLSHKEKEGCASSISLLSHSLSLHRSGRQIVPRWLPAPR